MIGLNIRQGRVWQVLSQRMPAIGKEFMPPLEEGSYLLMPTTMAHSGIEENTDVIRKVDAFVSQIPEDVDLHAVVERPDPLNVALQAAI